MSINYKWIAAGGVFAVGFALYLSQYRNPVTPTAHVADVADQRRTARTEDSRVRSQQVVVRGDLEHARPTARTASGDARSADQPRTPASDAGGLDALQRQVSVLADQVARQSALLATLEQQLNGSELERTQALSDEDIALIHEAERHLESQEDTRMAEHALLMEDSFAAEDVDDAWSRRSVDAIQNALGQESVDGAYVLDVSCRTSLCRLELEYDSAASQGEFESIVPRHLAAHFPSATVHTIGDESGDGARTVFYLARDGFDLPRE